MTNNLDLNDYSSYYYKILHLNVKLIVKACGLALINHEQLNLRESV